MKVFVTGASGFIGSYVCRELVASGHEVLALSREAAPWRIADLTDKIHLVRGGLNDQANWGGKLKAFAPDGVAHLGWAGVGNFDRNNPAQAQNVGWTTELLERCAQAGARAFVGVGSQAEYGVDPAPNKPEKPTTVYGEAKLAACRLSAVIAQQLDVRFAWLRVFSTYGPMDHPYWMLPGLIRQLLAGTRPALTGGDQQWDFLHVVDAARAVRMVLETDGATGIFPLGSGDAPLLRSTIETLRNKIDPSLPLGFGEIAYRSDQVMLLKADVSRLRDEIGWNAQTPLDAGLESTARWYRANSWIFDESSPTAT